VRGDGYERGLDGQECGKIMFAERG
jgi:hypothetical protein